MFIINVWQGHQKSFKNSLDVLAVFPKNLIKSKPMNEVQKRIEELKSLYGDYVFYYLLYWKKENESIVIRHFNNKKLYEMTNAEYVEFFEYATVFDLKRIKKLHEINRIKP